MSVNDLNLAKYLYSVKVRDLAQLSTLEAIVPFDSLEDGGLRRLAFNADGQLLAVAGTSAVHCYVTRLPQLGAACGVRVAVLTSLTEVTVHHDLVDRVVQSQRIH